MQKWEYTNVTGGYGGTDIQTKLNALGEQGWELGWMKGISKEPGTFVYIFKRPKK